MYGDDHFPEGIPVKETLARMVEEVVAEVGYDINIPEMTRTSININKIDGLDVCAPEAREKVISLQTAFSKHKDIYRNYSIYAVYVRDEDGGVHYLPGDSPKVKELIGDCNYVYTSVR